MTSDHLLRPTDVYKSSSKQYVGKQSRVYLEELRNVLTCKMLFLFSRRLQKPLKSNITFHKKT